MKIHTFLANFFHEFYHKAEFPVKCDTDPLDHHQMSKNNHCVRSLPDIVHTRH